MIFDFGKKTIDCLREVDLSFLVVNQKIIIQCRERIDSFLKKNIRRILLPYFKLRYGFSTLGEGFQWGRSWKINLGRGSYIGRYVYIGDNFDSAGVVVVGDLTMISKECKIVGDDHLYDIVGVPTRLAFSKSRLITVFESDVWIGKRVTIKEGVRIGRGAVVGTGAVVTKDVPPYSVVVGVPGRVVGRRFSDFDIVKHESEIFGV